MKSEPCVRFGTRIRPKINENPAESRNNSPPRLTLFTASTTHWLTGRPSGAPGLELHGCRIAGINRRREIFLLVIGPELADIGVGLHDGIDELAVLALEPADEDVADDIAEVVEAEAAARRVGERYRAQGVDQRLLVLGLSAGLLQRRLD